VEGRDVAALPRPSPETAPVERLSTVTPFNREARAFDNPQGFRFVSHTAPPTSALNWIPQSYLSGTSTRLSMSARFTVPLLTT
jgi:hypothetical protein